MNSVKEIASEIGQFIQANATHILTGAAICGTITTAIQTHKASTRAGRILAEADGLRELREQRTKRETFDLVWKVYIPPVLMGTITVGCILAANQIGTRRQAALASAYSLADKALRDYKDRVVDVFGENENRKIHEATVEDKLEENPLSKNEVIFLGDGDSLCYDTLSGRYFRTDIENINRIQNEVNKLLIHDGWVSVNDMYDIVGLDSIRLGSLLGWSSDDLLEFKVVSKIADNGDPCLVLDYYVEPKYDPYR